MAYLPVNARSEFVSALAPGVLRLMKSFDGGVFETRCMFHDASPALNQPALSPMRGSGLGGVVDMLIEPAWTGLGEELDAFDECVQDATASAAAENSGTATHEAAER